jgi:4-hydroxy-tetrahydrodipicolinate reductase
MTDLAILGAAGRMGSALVRCAASLPDLTVVAAIEEPACPHVGKDAGVAAGIGAAGVAISSDRQAVAQADVLVDFTFHTAAPHNAALAVNHERPLVIGTTGLSEGEAAAVRDAARTVPVVWAPNMSRGVNLLFFLVKRAAATLGLDYDVEIIEAHHRHKRDAPSGTALKLAAQAAEGRGQSLEEAVRHGREGMVGERPRGELGVHAVRAGDIVGDHTVVFAGEGERLELIHRATSRDALALGALAAARWVKGRAPGLYGMADVFGLPE